MTTQKELVEFHKKNRAKIEVVTFHQFGFGSPFYRIQSYGGLDLLQAFKEMQKQLAKGRRVILTDRKSGLLILKHEAKEKERCSYDWALQFSKQFN
jgi:hypothetical protein